MTKISNTSAYPNITTLDSADYLILTDKENSLMTKSCTISTLSSFITDAGVVKLIAPNGGVWKLFVSNSGVITTQAIS
tara:strand:- start:226 stop:459 length:234 start_codon:yes stop_codon:yes gene_type:complete